MPPVPPPPAVFAGSPFAALDVQTAVLVLLVAAVLVLAKAVADLHRKLAAVDVRAPRETAPARTPPVAVPTDDVFGDPRVVAAVVAAVQTALTGEAHRVVHISEPSGPAAWSIEGRRQIHASHVRR